MLASQSIRCVRSILRSTDNNESSRHGMRLVSCMHACIQPCCGRSPSHSAMHAFRHVACKRMHHSHTNQPVLLRPNDKSHLSDPCDGADALSTLTSTPPYLHTSCLVHDLTRLSIHHTGCAPAAVEPTPYRGDVLRLKVCLSSVVCLCACVCVRARGGL